MDAGNIRIMEEPYQPPFEYLFDEWHPQMIYFLDLESASLDFTRECFRQQYPDNAEADWKVGRFFSALSRMRELLVAHPDDFGKLNAPGRARTSSEHVIRAFYQLYAERPDSSVHEPAPVEAVLQLAQEFQAKRQRGFKGRAE
jgi:hypothetical protein